MRRYENIGIILTLFGAILWGVSGTSVQFIGNFRNMNLEWLLTMRLITAGLLTVLYGWVRQGNMILMYFAIGEIRLVLSYSAYSVWRYANTPIFGL